MIVTVRDPTRGVVAAQTGETIDFLIDSLGEVVGDPFVVAAFATTVVGALVVRNALEVVPDGERRALTVSGEYRGLLEPGVNVVPPLVSSTTPINVESQSLTAIVDGTETSDAAPVSVEATVEFQVTDPEAAFRKVDDHAGRFLEDVEFALYDAVESVPVAELQEEPATFAGRLRERLDAETSVYGITVHDVVVDSATTPDDG